MWWHATAAQSTRSSAVLAVLALAAAALALAAATLALVAAALAPVAARAASFSARAALAADQAASAAAPAYHPREGRLLDQRQPRGVDARRGRRVGSPFFSRFGPCCSQSRRNDRKQRCC